MLMINCVEYIYVMVEFVIWSLKIFSHFPILFSVLGAVGIAR